MALDGAHTQTHRHTDGHGDSLTNSAQWGRVGENGKTNIYAKSPLKCETLTYLFSTSLELGLQTETNFSIMINGNPCRQSQTNGKPCSRELSDLFILAWQPRFPPFHRAAQHSVGEDNILEQTSNS